MPIGHHRVYERSVCYPTIIRWFTDVLVGHLRVFGWVADRLVCHPCVLGCACMPFYGPRMGRQAIIRSSYYGPGFQERVEEGQVVHPMVLRSVRWNTVVPICHHMALDGFQMGQYCHSMVPRWLASGVQ
jgi:hypothetical protein